MVNQFLYERYFVSHSSRAKIIHHSCQYLIIRVSARRECVNCVSRVLYGGIACATCIVCADSMVPDGIRMSRYIVSTRRRDEQEHVDIERELDNIGEKKKGKERGEMKPKRNGAREEGRRRSGGRMPGGERTERRGEAKERRRGPFSYRERTRSSTRHQDIRDFDRAARSTTAQSLFVSRILFHSSFSAL